MNQPPTNPTFANETIFVYYSDKMTIFNDRHLFLIIDCADGVEIETGGADSTECPGLSGMPNRCSARAAKPAVSGQGDFDILDPGPGASRKLTEVEGVPSRDSRVGRIGGTIVAEDQVNSGKSGPAVLARVVGNCWFQLSSTKSPSHQAREITAEK